MNDSFISLKEIETELKDIGDLRAELVRSFLLLSQKIRYIFSKIKSCETIDNAKDYLDVLDQIRDVLLLFIFEEEIGIPERLDQFARESDRFMQDRVGYFEKIKSGELVF